MLHKEDTLSLKGVAIIMMLLYHLFYVKQGGGYNYLLSFGDVPLIKRFSEICYPVSLYIMLSGYGLYASYNSTGSVKWWKRTKNLYFHLWIIYLIFLPIACIMKPDKYPGGLIDFVENMFSLRCSYNTEQWFLMPYLILLAISLPLFRLIDKLRPSIALLLALAVEMAYIFSYKVLGVGGVHDFLSIFIQLYLAMGFLLPFILGALAKKSEWIERFWENCPTSLRKYKGTSSIMLLLGIVIGRLFVPNQSFSVLVSLLLVLLFPSINLGQIAKNVLQFLGKHSLNIWLIHTWICYYLFKDVIYGFRWPMLIFVITLLLSIIVSLLVEFIYKNIVRNI